MVLKRKAAAAAGKGALAQELKNKNVNVEVEEEPQDDVEMEEEHEEEAESAEDRVKREEKEWAAHRPKDLKGMYMDDLKKLAESKGVATGKKEEMIKLIIKAESKERSERRAHEEKIRAVIQKKSDELKALDLSELKQQANVKGKVSKVELIAQLLKTWQDNDGVDKAMKDVALQERRSELASQDVASLLKVCDKKGIDPYVLEVMVDRILEHETRHDKYAPPAPPKDDKPAEEVKRGTDLVEALLASEANRKQELERQKEKEAADMAKVKDLNKMGVDALKKLVMSKGHDGEGKKEDLVKAAFQFAQEEEQVEVRRKELKALAVKDLKQLLSSNGLDASGKVPDMINTQLKYEKRVQEEFRAYEAKVKEMVDQKKSEYEGLPLVELKKLLEARGMKGGKGKAEGALRLAEEAQKDGSITKKISQMTRDERKAALLAMDKSAVLKLCTDLSIDPVLKDVVVQRIMSYESDVADGFVEPETKKAKTSKK